MHNTPLKEIISWIATHGIKAYSAETIARDLNIFVDPSFHSVTSVISIVLHDALSSAQLITGIDTPTSADDFFDIMLTVLENLSDYKANFQIIFQKDNLSFESFSLASTINGLTESLLTSKIETFLDKLTYNIIICSIFYEWLKDSTPDLSHTTTKINHISQNIFAYR